MAINAQRRPIVPDIPFRQTECVDLIHDSRPRRDEFKETNRLRLSRRDKFFPVDDHR